MRRRLCVIVRPLLVALVPAVAAAAPADRGENADEVTVNPSVPPQARSVLCRHRSLLSLACPSEPPSVTGSFHLFRR
jgi:hypothetical protein